MSARGLRSAFVAILALLAVSSAFVANGFSVFEAWLLASLAVGGFMLMVLAPFAAFSAARRDARTVAFRVLTKKWQQSAHSLRAEVESGIVLRQSVESKLARADVLESCADAVLGVLREAEGVSETGAEP